MSKAMETAREEASGWRTYVLAGYYVLAGNFSLTVAAAGVLMILFGTSLETLAALGGIDWHNVPVLAGMFGIWGTTLVLMGLIAYAFFWTSKKFAEVSTE